MFGMDVALDTNSADTQLQATLALGGATLQVDNEMDGDNLEAKSQTVGIKGSYGTMSYGLGWQADGDLGFSIGTNLGGIGLTIARVNAGSNYSMGLAASVDLGGGMTLNASNAQNSDGLQDKSFNYDSVSVDTDGTMSYGLGWQADGDLGFSIGTTLGGIGLTISRVNAGSNYSMGLAAAVDLGGGMTLNATNAQNSDGLQDKSFNYDSVSVDTDGSMSFATNNTITEAFQLKAVHKSISTVGLNYAGGGTTVGITYQEKAGTSAGGDNLIASGSMAISPTITLTGTYNKDDALTTIGASGPLGSAGTLSAVMTSTGSSTLTASFKF
jgi:hypothetical protein